MQFNADDKVLDRFLFHLGFLLQFRGLEYRSHVLFTSRTSRRTEANSRSNNHFLNE